MQPILWGIQYEDVSQQITFHYVDQSGVLQTALAQLILREDGTPMNTDTYCDCEKAEEFMALYEEFLGDVFDEHRSNGGSFPSNYFPNSLTEILPFLVNPDITLGANGFDVTHDIFLNGDDVYFYIDSCFIAFGFGGSLSVPIGYVYDPSTATYLPNDIPVGATFSLVDVYLQGTSYDEGIHIVLED